MSSVEELLFRLTRTPQILLVEGDRASAKTLIDRLRARYDCHVDWARNGTDVYNAVREKSYDLVLVEAGEISVDVIDVVKHGTEAPIVVIAGIEDAQRVFRAAEGRMIGLLERPVTPEALARVFRTLRIRAREAADQRYFHAAGAYA